ncbi:MAG: RecQ family ATP-dependent DNA helicase [Mongoliibacter sp.]|uniref:RecQ family ATP-dependent DNA helicase n=1 Tax=Mongoliibacter sp. TaxID=2022438 RepID=UPI0012EF44B2|nr:RecQ family ATP-dependent DNA helicase [Mongoliibacter sp.]TVP53234.1 MAG: RecQ family ATP-dependent DNA helicase [Mongoliibacter sp.]
MKSSITFIDIEVEPNSGKILDFGAVNSNGNTFHSQKLHEFLEFTQGSAVVCGHNIFGHDLIYFERSGIRFPNFIDTLYLSPLLFPERPYHHLVKDDKLQTDSLNNPLNDAQKAKDLFFDEVSAFLSLDSGMQEIFYSLLHKTKEFKGFFDFVDYHQTVDNPTQIIREKFEGLLCTNAELESMEEKHPLPLAYALSLIHSGDRFSITPPWVLQQFPETDRLMTLLRGRPCLPGCTFCNEKHDIHVGLEQIFGYDRFRSYGGEPLQEKAVQAAVDGKSLLAIFPTGGGKSITFQLPALMAGRNEMALTVVISPLQSLMKDQVDNLETLGITDAVTINGLLDPIERAKSFERVEDGSASLLYISPESLRSKSIERLLLGRKINRFVIDEAHCFSSWGQDFRIDYLYIADFIRALETKKRLQERIPVSCFTATAKQKVIEDIRTYFKDKLSLQLEIFRSTVSRTNLKFEVVERNKEEDKYASLRDLLEAKQCPSIIYVSRTRRAFLLAERLNIDGFQARAYHGKMDKSEKTENQNAFIAGEIDIMVATSAFGMGVDKKDVGLVVHYEISDSLENYVQEAGRAGRDENIEADCYVLFDEEDLSKHFILLNQTKLGIKEIQQVWKAIKELTRYRRQVSNSALEIARKAGWDDSIMDLETRVTTAIAALEDAGYLKRGQNMPRIFASSIQTKTAQEAISKIELSTIFSDKHKEKAVRIIKKLFSSKGRKKAQDEEAEARVDYIADHLGMVKEDVIEIIQLLREEKILADAKDLKAFVRKSENFNRSLDIVDAFGLLENFLLPQLSQKPEVYNLKALNEAAEFEGLQGVSPVRIRSVINYWSIKNWVTKRFSKTSKNHVELKLNLPMVDLKEKFRQRHELSKFIIQYLFEHVDSPDKDLPLFSGELSVDFSVHELKEGFESSSNLFVKTCTTAEVEDALFYLSRIESIKIEGGFLVLYNRLTVERTTEDTRSRYKQEDYQKLEKFYENKVQQIHIVGEYAKKMIADYQDALQFVEDYFQMNYAAFLNKYFKGHRQKEISQNITPAKFKKLFGELSPAQLKIINDRESKYIVVAAGPGSGKTRILVHKLAALLLMEDVKQEQLLMLTFSRAAATEFKKRLMELIGNAALYVDIKTFHSYCFDLLGKMGTLEKAGDIIQQATALIRENKAEVKEITKTVLVIDEAQDMSVEEYALVEALMDQNEEMRVIAVGDDDQNIYEFRGSSSQYLEQFITEKKAVKYELVENYRSKGNLVDFTNQWVETIAHRLKYTPIMAKDQSPGILNLIKHAGDFIIQPFVEEILSTDLKGTVGVLTKTNEEALKVVSLLLKNKLPASLVQSNDLFNLWQLYEVRTFVNALRLQPGEYTILEEKWKQAKEALKKHFGGSTTYEWVSNMLEDFEKIYPKVRFKSDLETFVSESRIEDFYRQSSESVMVSTIHKAKGREFDQVFMLLQQKEVREEKERRLFYVGMTRGKSLLSIHYNGQLLNGLKVPTLNFREETEIFEDTETLILHLLHRDVWLGYFHSRQKTLFRLRPGEVLKYRDHECFNEEWQSVLRFSNAFKITLEDFAQKGYQVQSVKVNWMLYWRDPDEDKEILVLLPEVVMGRKADVKR